MSRCNDCRSDGEDIKWRVSDDWLCDPCDKKREAAVAKRDGDLPQSYNSATRK